MHVDFEVNVKKQKQRTKKRTIADHLLILSAPVDSPSKKCMGFDTGYSYLLAEYTYLF